MNSSIFKNSYSRNLLWRQNKCDEGVRLAPGRLFHAKCIGRPNINDDVKHC